MRGGKRKEFSSSVCLIFYCLCFPMPESVIKSLLTLNKIEFYSIHFQLSEITLARIVLPTTVLSQWNAVP